MKTSKITAAIAILAFSTLPAALGHYKFTKQIGKNETNFFVDIQEDIPKDKIDSVARDFINTYNTGVQNQDSIMLYMGTRGYITKGRIEVFGVQADKEKNWVPWIGDSDGFPIMDFLRYVRFFPNSPHTRTVLQLHVRALESRNVSSSLLFLAEAQKHYLKFNNTELVQFTDSLASTVVAPHLQTSLSDTSIMHIYLGYFPDGVRAGEFKQSLDSLHFAWSPEGIAQRKAEEAKQRKALEKELSAKRKKLKKSEVERLKMNITNYETETRLLKADLEDIDAQSESTRRRMNATPPSDAKSRLYSESRQLSKARDAKLEDLRQKTMQLDTLYMMFPELRPAK